MHILHAFIWACMYPSGVCQSAWGQRLVICIFLDLQGLLLNLELFCWLLACNTSLPPTDTSTGTGDICWHARRHQGAEDANSGQCNTLFTKLSPQILHLQSFLEQKDHTLPRPFSLYSLPISYRRWLLIDNWSNTVGYSYLSQPSSQQKNKHSHRPGPVATSSPSPTPSIRGGLSCLFSFSPLPHLLAGHLHPEFLLFLNEVSLWRHRIPQIFTALGHTLPRVL